MPIHYFEYNIKIKKDIDIKLKALYYFYKGNDLLPM